jgi:hypothetical protein
MALSRRTSEAGNAIATYATSEPTQVSLSVASAVSAQLKNDTAYRIWASVDAFFLPGGSTVAATTNSHPLKAGLDILHLTDKSNLFIAGIVASGTGVLYISEIGVGTLVTT